MADISSSTILSRRLSIGGPEAIVRKNEKVAVPSEVLHRLQFPRDQIAANVVNYFGFEHKKAAADPGTIALRLFIEAFDPSSGPCAA